MASLSLADYRGSLGRYALFGEIASGGMATVHFARLLGAQGFARTVAIKRMHPHLARDPELVAMFLREAHLAARIRHPNVVSTLDVVSEKEELFLVMEYVAGEALSRLLRKTREAGRRLWPAFTVAILVDALEGLHAAHEAADEHGRPLGIVHRDVSPQNLHVGVDGTTRVLDFGIAKATARTEDTGEEMLKGKLSYMAPEQLAGLAVDRRTDVYAAAVILWEALTGQKLHSAADVPALVYAVTHGTVPAPSTIVPGLPKALDAVVLKGLSRDPDDRYPTARAMAEALEPIVRRAPPRKIGAFVVETAGKALAWRQEFVACMESSTSSGSMEAAAPFSIVPAGLEVASGIMPAGSVPDMDELDALARGSSLPPSRAAHLPSDDRRTEPAGPDAAAAARTRRRLVTVAVMAVLMALGALALRDAVTTALRGEAPGDPASTLRTERPVAPAAPTPPEPAIVLGRGQRPAALKR